MTEAVGRVTIAAHRHATPDPIQSGADRCKN